MSNCGAATEAVFESMRASCDSEVAGYARDARKRLRESAARLGAEEITISGWLVVAEGRWPEGRFFPGLEYASAKRDAAWQSTLFLSQEDAQRAIIQGARRHYKEYPNAPKWVFGQLVPMEIIDEPCLLYPDGDLYQLKTACLLLRPVAVPHISRVPILESWVRWLWGYNEEDGQGKGGVCQSQ